jgi:tetratricopeptide (TPR) repeat protein
MSGNVDPHCLVIEGKYDEAIAVYTNLINTDKSNYFSRAIVYLQKGEYDKALEDIKLAEEDRNSQNPDRTDIYLKTYGIVLWINKQEKEAAEIWYQLIKDVQAGKIKYSTDLTGGLVNGYLLWFAGCRNESLAEYIEKTKSFLFKKSKKRSIEYWSGPIAQYILGNISESDLLDAAETESDILTSRQLCQAHFYIAINYYLNGDKENYVRELQACVENGKKTMLEYEIYLAQYELARIKKPLA